MAAASPLDPPSFLPPDVAVVVAMDIGLTVDDVQTLWTVLKENAWDDVRMRVLRQDPRDSLQGSGVPFALSASWSHRFILNGPLTLAPQPEPPFGPLHNGA